MKARTEKRAFRVVITGGPCAGKTEVWRFLGEAFPQSVLVPEAATELILAGRTEWSLGLENFQRAVFERQQVLEEEALNKGLLLLCDRGLLDGVAYLPGLLSVFDVSGEAILSRYELVIQLAVIRDPGTYALHSMTNPARHEGHARALAIERELMRIYEKHPTYVFLAGSLEKKKREAHRTLGNRLAATRPDLAVGTCDHA
jgi:predicted ATPase